MKTYDVVIVGNGVLGFSLAFALSLHCPKISIAIVGKNSYASSASAAAGAMLGCYGEVTQFALNNKFLNQKLTMASMD